MEKFKAVHYTMNNCIEDIYQMVLVEKDIDYTWMYVTAWGFGLNENIDGTIGRKIFANRENVWRDIREEENLLRYTGIQVIWEEFQSLAQVEQSVEKHGFVGVRADSYVCPWNDAYQKAHIEHYVLIVEDRNAQFKLLDPYIQEEEILMDKSFFEEHIKQGKMFYFLPERMRQELNPDIYNIMKKNAAEMLGTDGGKSDFDQMRRFGELVADINEIRQEFEESKSMQFAPIVRKIEQIMYGRMKYVEFLNCQYKQKNRMIELVKEHLLEAVNEWSIIKSYIMKEQFMHFSGKQIPKFQSRLNKVILLEEETAKFILKGNSEWKK